MVFRQLLLVRYKKGLKAYRVEGDVWKKPVDYDIYGPLALANIAGIEDVMQDRAIPIFLLRSINPKILNSKVDFSSPLWPELRNLGFLLFMQYFSEVSEVCGQCEAVLTTAEITSRERTLATNHYPCNLL